MVTTGMESLLHAALFPTRAGARCQEYSGHSNKLMVSLGCIRGVRSLLQIWTCVTTVLSMWEVRVLLFLGLGTKQSSSVRSSGMECCYVSCPSPLCISRAQRHHTPHTERDSVFSLACGSESKSYHPTAHIPLTYLGHLQLTSVDLLCWP